MVDTRKHYRNCNLCGREYKFCSSCTEYDHLPRYMLAFCSGNCKDTDIILSNWGAKIIDSATAAELLKSKDLSRMEFWNDNYKAAYAKIMEDVTPVVEKKEEKKEQVVEDHKLTISEEIKKSSKSKAKIVPKGRVVKDKED